MSIVLFVMVAVVEKFTFEARNDRVYKFVTDEK